MASSPQEAAKSLMKNTQFLQLFQKVLSGNGSKEDQDYFASMPKEGDPKREEWLRQLQQKLHKETMQEAKKELEQVHSDSNGQWMYVLPNPGFCIKCRAAGGSKIFINIAHHSRIGEPVPMEHGKSEGGEQETRFRVPLSCGQARPEKDKSGKPCKVYDVIVNTLTMTRCTEEHEFRRFVAALCMQWIQQKYEPTLNIDEFGNLNFKVKGVMEPQRIRLSTVPKEANALQNEIKLPATTKSPSAPSLPSGVSGTGKLIEELRDIGENKLEGTEVEKKVFLTSETLNCGDSTSFGSTSLASASGSAGKVPRVLCIQKDSQYDWTTHAKPALNPLFKEAVPARYMLQLYIPTVQSIKEVSVVMTSKKLECYYVDQDPDGEEPFLTVVFDYPVNDDPEEAKFIRAKHILKLTARVVLPDETLEPRTKPARDAEEEEREEVRKRDEQRKEQYNMEKARADRLKEEEEIVMRTRRSMVENLAALQGGSIPPALKQNLDEMPQDHLSIMLCRLESGTQQGDQVDQLIQKLPQEVKDSICDYIRDKLSLEPRRKNELKMAPSSQRKDNIAPLPVNESKRLSSEAEGKIKENSIETTLQEVPEAIVEGINEEDGADLRTYNYAKRSEELFGIEFHNRYLFALDS